VNKPYHIHRIDAKTRFFIIFAILITLLVLNACVLIQAQDELGITPIASPITKIPTSTIQWFPPTSTPTLFPTPWITPTISYQPKFEEPIFSDDFSDPSLWMLSESVYSSIALGVNEITLAVSQPGLYLYSLRNTPILKDFYLEITASPGICAGEDEYGLLLRVTPFMEFYRFALTCNGQVRLDKYFNSQASSPQPKIPSGDVPPGAPSTSRLGVWALDKEMHFYLNKQYQFSLRDPSLLSGTMGVFVHSEGDNAISVSFSNLIVYKVTSK
jgi:hypothetical protein